MRAAVLVEPGRIEMEERPIPTPGQGDVLVRVSSVGVCGSDPGIFKGKSARGARPYPIILGHEMVGRVYKMGQRVSIEPQRPDPDSEETRRGHYNLCPHMRFFATPPADGALCDYVTIGAKFAHPVPDSMSNDAAALCEPLSVGIAAIRKAELDGTSRVLIAGAGPIGIVMTQLARAYGATDIVVSDPDQTRRDRAVAFGATTVIDPTVEQTDELTVDAFIDASGAAAAVAAGIRAVRPAGRVVLVGSGAETMELPTQLIQNRELVLTGVFRYANTWPTAIALVESGRVDLDAMVTARFPLEKAAEALDSDRIPGSVKSVVTVS